MPRRPALLPLLFAALLLACTSTPAPKEAPRAFGFVPPEGYQRNTQEQIDQGHWAGPPPDELFTAPELDSYISMQHSEQPLPPGHLPRVADAIREQFDAPSIDILDQRLAHLGDRDWVVLELRKRTVEPPTHDLFCATSLRGTLFFVHLVSTEDAFPAQSAAFREAMETFTERE